ncbi:carotenoid oxygenase [Diplodia corticola]|uniref:Carotenoid oxygenase n=1 Tax=Diplodia corticola TaxID=236234 RepID=A0A1J9R760_9PEZI|nr:carotenoid oxygenase [Diplodia corticola]OJD37350.1 carotenoid oxygenase [Diplodia corticola]
MPQLAGPRRETSSRKHPYLSGNYAPIKQTRQLTPCIYTGCIPEDLVGGQYVRNGGNPITNEELGRDAHWFDGDGMLAGVLFEPTDHGRIQPKFVAQFILTDVLLSTLSNPALRFPILPSIATLVSPLSSLLTILLSILRTVLLVILSHLPGSRQAIKKISVANTAIYYHDGRALATCESGPPIRVSLPDLSTIGWFNGSSAEGESERKVDDVGFGGNGLLSFMKEWTTGHPKVDRVTDEMILYHCTFAPPYIHYSVLSATKDTAHDAPSSSKLINMPVSGVSGGKMMHDFGVSRRHTIIMDLPLTLDPLNLIKNKQIVSYDPSAPSRFGVFPRRNPSNVHWFETAACCIFHTANAWDSEDKFGDTRSVNLLACRLTSAALVYSAGNVPVPKAKKRPSERCDKPSSYFDKHDFDGTDATAGNISLPESSGFDAAPALESPLQGAEPPIQPLMQMEPQPEPDSISSLLDEEEQCRLYYYSFILPSRSSPQRIATQHALSAVPLEFPTVNPAYAMRFARYVYGCSLSSSSFGAALGKAAKIDVLVKLDVQILIARGQQRPPSPVTGCVDRRSVSEVLAQQDKLDDLSDPVRCFKMPSGWYAQEARFVAKRGAHTEDEGYLLFYAFDENQLSEEGEAGTDAVSELWILDARSMQDVVAKIKLPQRVPYGLHGEWFDESQIRDQRPFEKARSVDGVTKDAGVEKGLWRVWMGARRKMERCLA